LIQIVGHISSGHIEGGWRTPGSNKTCFPENMSKTQVEKAIREAYRHGKKINTQPTQVSVEEYYDGMKIEMWIDLATNEIKSAWPVK